MEHKPGSNFYAKLNDEVKICFTDDDGFVTSGECDSNPNVVATQTDTFVTGCEMRRTDLLIGDNIYRNTGTLASPSWTQSGGGGGMVINDPVIGGVDNSVLIVDAFGNLNQTTPVAPNTFLEWDGLGFSWTTIAPGGVNIGELVGGGHKFDVLWIDDAIKLAQTEN